MAGGSETALAPLAAASENAGAPAASLEVLKAQVMAEIDKRWEKIEAQFAQKEESLWRRGQVEIRRLQAEQQQLKENVERLQGALYDVTTKFEVVVSEMHQVLRALPQVPGNVGELRTPAPASRCGGNMPEDDEGVSFARPAPFCTPPRGKATGDCSNMPLTPSPAVLSLASVLPSSASPAGSFAGAKTPQLPTPGTSQKLQLATCLDSQEPSTATPAAQRSPRLSSSPRPAAATSSGSPAPLEIRVELSKEPGFHTLGVEVNHAEDGALQVEAVDQHGLVARHNARQETDASRILRGDRLVEVNGVSLEPAQMLQECKVQAHLSIALLRPGRGGPPVGREARADGVAGAAHGADDWAVSPLPSRRLRPEAEVFVPSAQKEAKPLVVAPAGSEEQGAPRCEEAAGASGKAVQAAALAPGAVPAAAALAPCDGDDGEVKRLLFA